MFSDDAIRATADTIQWVNLAASVAMVALLLLALRRWPRGWRLTILPLSYAVLSSAFYVAVLLDAILAPWTSLLSAALRLYSYVLVLAIGGVVVLDARRAEEEDEEDDNE